MAFADGDVFFRLLEPDMRQSLRVILSVAALWSIAPLSSIAAPAPPSEAMEMLEEPLPTPTQIYVDATGEETTLASFKGKVVILNFWATWCAPCVRELPSLDRLAAILPTEKFAVLALSSDRGGADKAAPFLENLGVKTLQADLDPRSKLALSLGLRGLPTTYVLDKDVMVIAKLQGIAEWDSAEYVAWFNALADQ
jgi:thiol-disulfide isomerase/thioredoxin